jgi:hypothetical protein
MARAQRPQEALPTPRACKRPERSGGPGRRKNLERRWRRGREEAGLPAGEILLSDGLWAAPAGSSALQSRQERHAEPPRKGTVAHSPERRQQRQAPLPLPDPHAAGISPEREEPTTTRDWSKHNRSWSSRTAIVARASERCRTSEDGPSGPTDGLLHCLHDARRRRHLMSWRLTCDR